MKKVIHLISTIERGGAENQLLTLVSEQRELGFEVSVFPLKEGLDLMQDFITVGAEVNLELVGHTFMGQVLILKRLIPNTGLVIHAHLPRAELLGAMSVGNNILILSRHNSEPFFPGAPRWISQILAKFVSGKSKAVIAISRAVADFVINAKEISSEDKLNVVLYGYRKNLDRKGTEEQSRKFIGFAEESGPVIGTVGRLVPQKDYPTLLNAFQILKGNFPNAALIILGEGIERHTLEAEAVKLNIHNSVFFLGKKTNVDDYLTQMDLFVLASKYEGFGMVLLEAMSAKIPIVASNNSAIPEVIGVEHPGLANTGDSVDFASKMALLLEDPLRKRVIQLQSNRLTKFDSSSMAKEVVRLYYT